MSRLELIFTSLICAVVLALSGPVRAQESKETKTAERPVVIDDDLGAVQVIRMSATVEAVDVAKRSVTLKGANGTVSTVTVGPIVRNLAQVKVGDTVVVDRYESVATDIKKSDGGTPTITETLVTNRAKQGEMPAGVVLHKVHAVTDVQGVNAETQTVLVKGPMGNLAEVKVRDPKALADLRAGAQIDITYVEGVAIKVERAKKK